MRRLTKRELILQRRSGIVTLWLAIDVLAALKATGPGWKTRVNELLRAVMGLRS